MFNQPSPRRYGTSRLARATGRAAKPQDAVTVRSDCTRLRKVTTQTKRSPRNTISLSIQRRQTRKRMSRSEPLSISHPRQLEISQPQRTNRIKHTGGVAVLRCSYKDTRENKPQSNIETPPSHSASGVRIDKQRPAPCQSQPTLRIQ